MKKIILSIFALATIGFTSCKKETESSEKSTTKVVATNTANFGVRGNCGMCKKNIEKAANSVEGVSNAIWDVNKKSIEVSFDSIQTNLTAIHTAIAKSGYDTDKITSDEVAYDKLPACCQYDHTMKMNVAAVEE